MTDVEKRNIAIIVTVVIAASIGFPLVIRHRNLAKTPVTIREPVDEIPQRQPIPILHATNSEIFDTLPRP